jgi:long-subunit fatty acid transport protein
MMSTGITAAQEPQLTPPRFQLTFTNPGARSMGFGGAFVALADDATAAFANPAGLVQLLRPEISGELRLRYAKLTTGDDPYFLHDDFTGLGFVSFVYPFSRWSIAAYAHNAARSDTSMSDIIFSEEISDVLITSYGVSAAYRLSDHFHVGLGLSYYERREGAFTSWNESKDEDVGVTAGFLWNITNQVNAGGFFRQGPELQLPIPDVYGLGAAFRTSSGNLAVSFEWDHVAYSKLIENEVSFDLTVEDADELHLGAEYAFLKMSPVLALRLGVWLDPDHRARRLSEVDPGSDDLVHLAAGLGLAFERFQVDLGADVSDEISSVSLSVVFTF